MEGVSWLGREVGVEVVFPRCAGLDVHRDTVAAAVRIQSGQENRSRWGPPLRAAPAQIPASGTTALGSCLG